MINGKKNTKNQNLRLPAQKQNSASFGVEFIIGSTAGPPARRKKFSSLAELYLVMCWRTASKSIEIHNSQNNISYFIIIMYIDHCTEIIQKC